MKSEDLKKIKEKVKELQTKKNEVLELQKKISKLKETEQVKKYLELLDILEEKTTGINKEIDKLTDDQLISIALRQVDITPDEEIYVYIGTYKYNREIDIVHGSTDIPVKRTNRDADYVVYENLESEYNGTVLIPYKKADEFEENHKIIIPHNVLFIEKYFYKLQTEYFKTMILESPELANEKINKLIKK